MKLIAKLGFDLRLKLLTNLIVKLGAKLRVKLGINILADSCAIFLNDLIVHFIAKLSHVCVRCLIGL
jgi:hypothetical protein